MKQAFAERVRSRLAKRTSVEYSCSGEVVGEGVGMRKGHLIEG